MLAHLSIEGRDNILYTVQYVLVYIQYSQNRNLFTIKSHGAPKEFLQLDFDQSYFWHGLILLL